MPRISGNRIIYDGQDWLASVSSTYRTSLDGLAQRVDNKLTNAIAFDPFRAVGFLSPAPNPSDVTNVSAISDYLMGSCIAFEGSTRYGYFIGFDGKLHRMELASQTVSNSGSWPHQTTGAGVETGLDCLTYKLNVAGTLTSCVLWSWVDSGGTWNVGLFNTSAGTFDDDFMSSVPADPLVPTGNTRPHPMIVGADDIVYIGDGNKLHAYDGQDGTNGKFTDTVLLLPSDMIITSLSKTEDGLAVFAYKNQVSSVIADTAAGSEATCYMWDYLSNDPIRVISLDDDVVTCSGVYKNSLYCITAGTAPVREIGGTNRYGRLRIFNGRSFDILANFNGNPPTKNGSIVINDSIQWLSDGNLLAYGSPLEGISSGFNALAKLSGTSNGLLVGLPGILGRVAASTGATTSGGLQTLSSNYSDQTFVVTAPALPLFSPGKKGRVLAVTVFFGKTSTGGRSITMGLAKENATTMEFISNVKVIDSTNQIYRYKFTSANVQIDTTFQDLRLYADYGTGDGATDAPIPAMVVVEFEEVNIS